MGTGVVWGDNVRGCRDCRQCPLIECRMMSYIKMSVRRHLGGSSPISLGPWVSREGTGEDSY